MRDDVQDHVDAVIVGVFHKVTELLAGSEVRIDIEEVLDAVAVIRRLERDLAEYRADPKGCHSQPLQIAEFAPQALESPSLPRPAGGEPAVVVYLPRALLRVERRGAARRWTALVIAMPSLLLTVGEPVQKQEVQDLVLPGGGRWRECPSRKGSEVDVVEALFDHIPGRYRISEVSCAAGLCQPPGGASWLIASAGPQVLGSYSSNRSSGLEHGIDDAPRFFDVVFAGEQRLVARHGVAQHAFVRLYLSGRRHDGWPASPPPRQPFRRLARAPSHPSRWPFPG